MVMLYATLLALAGQAQVSAIEGRVTQLGTSAGLSEVRVSVFRHHPDLPQTPQALTAARAAASVSNSSTIDRIAQNVKVDPAVLKPAYASASTTDSEGRFSFRDLVPGLYTLSIQGDALFAPRSAGWVSRDVQRTIVLKAGERLTDLEVPMTRGGILSGRVRNPEGRPVPDITVSAHEMAYPNGRATWNALVSDTTDDRGEFRLFGIPPGDYFIGVRLRSVAGSSVHDAWAETFYPGVTDPSGAIAIAIGSGAEISGIDIDIRSAVPSYTISGTAINPLPGLAANAAGMVDRSVSEFFLVPRKPPLTYGVVGLPVSNALPPPARPDQEFEIRNVKPGVYDLYASYRDPNTRISYTSRTEVVIGNTDVRDLALTVSPGVPLEAHLVRDGASVAQTELHGVALRLRPLDTTPATLVPGALPFGADGRILAENLPEARYTIELTGLPNAAFVSAVLQNGRNVYDEGVVLSRQPSPIQIVISSGGSVSGRVRAAANYPLEASTVVLVPPEPRRHNPGLFKTATPDAQGRFLIQGVSPGTYTVFACEDLPFREPWLNAEFLARYRDHGKVVNVTADSVELIDMELPRCRRGL